jgi:hypothetical protein
MMQAQSVMPHAMSSALAIAFPSCQQQHQSYEHKPDSDPRKDRPHRQRLFSDELAEDEGASHEIRQLAQRVGKSGALSRL